MIDQENGVFAAVCPLDCPDTCGLLLHKENGKIVKVAGNPDHPTTKGAICNKVRNMTERVYHPERLQYPMRRVGAKVKASLNESAGRAVGRLRRNSLHCPRPTDLRASCPTASTATWAFLG